MNNTKLIELMTPRDWQMQANKEAAELVGTSDYYAKAAEAKRYGMLADALEASQAEIERVNTGWQSLVLDIVFTQTELDKALARLAEIEKQEPVIYQSKTKPGFLSTSIYAWEDCEKADFLIYEADGVHVRKLYEAAGASPKPSDCSETGVCVRSGLYAAKQPSQAQASFDECVASGQSCQYGPHGMRWEMQCSYCGKEQPSQSHYEEQPEGTIIPVDPSEMQPSQAVELSEPIENLIDATEALMEWQVKNVKVWHNGAYDTAHMRIEQLRAAINAKGNTS